MLLSYLWKGVPLLCQFKADWHDAKLPSNLRWFFVQSPLNYRLTMHFHSREYLYRNTSSDNHYFFIHVAALVTIFWSWLLSGTLIVYGFICFLLYSRSIINHEYSCGKRINKADLQFSISILSDVHCNATSGSKCSCHFSHTDFYFPIKGWFRKSINWMYVKSWKKAFSTIFNHFESTASL